MEGQPGKPVKAGTGLTPGPSSSRVRLRGWPGSKNVRGFLASLSSSLRSPGFFGKFLPRFSRACRAAGSL